MVTPTDIWVKNSEVFFKSIIKIINEKTVIYNYEVHVEMLFIRRLFVDWIYASSTSFSELRKYVVFKSALTDYLKSFLVNKDNCPKFLLIYKDFNVFMLSHGDYFLDIYWDCRIRFIKKSYRLIVFSIISVFLFYKWRKKRNDSIRHWMNYNTRRKKKKFDIDMSSFDNLVLNEAQKYGAEYREKIYSYTL